MGVFSWIALIVFAGAVIALIVRFERTTAGKSDDSRADAADKAEINLAAYEYRVYRDLVWRGYSREEAREIARKRKEEARQKLPPVY